MVGLVFWNLLWEMIIKKYFRGGVLFLICFLINLMVLIIAKYELGKKFGNYS